MLLLSNLLTGYIASHFSDKDWQQYIEDVSAPAYREVGFTEGYYRARYDLCLGTLGSEYDCLRIAIYQYRNQYHKTLTIDDWNWRRVKGYEYH